MMVNRENYLERRAMMNGMLDGMNVQNQAANDEKMSKVNTIFEKVKTRDGLVNDLHVYRPKTLESQSAPAYIYAHGGGGWVGTI